MAEETQNLPVPDPSGLSDPAGFDGPVDGALEHGADVAAHIADSAHSTNLLEDTNTWLMLSFLIFLVVLWKAGKDALLSALDKRSDTIRKDIEIAENLRIEAQELLAQYQRKQRDAEKEAKKILDDAKETAGQIQAQAEKEFEEMVARREAQLAERVARIKENAMDEIQSYAADLAIQATTEIVAKELDKKAGSALIDDAIKAVAKNVH